MQYQIIVYLFLLIGHKTMLSFKDSLTFRLVKKYTNMLTPFSKDSTVHPTAKLLFKAQRWLAANWEQMLYADTYSYV